MPTLAQISQEMEEMYGASFDCGLDKTGDNHILKFYIENGYIYCENTKSQERVVVGTIDKKGGISDERKNL